MRLFLVILATICACNGAAISRDENILLNAILNASNNNKQTRTTWSRFKSLLFSGLYKDNEENPGKLLLQFFL